MAIAEAPTEQDAEGASYMRLLQGTGSGLVPLYLRETRLFGSSGNDRLGGGLVFDGICQVIQ